MKTTGQYLFEMLQELGKMHAGTEEMKDFDFILETTNIIAKYATLIDAIKIISKPNEN